jgi:flavin reductase (DIM6/NTAB) family NADH-FMN oxidoreductase RutF
MAKVKLDLKPGPLPLLGAYPVILIGTTVNGVPDFTTVAWTGVAASFPPAVTIALQHQRHSLKGVRRNMAFSVNIPGVDLVRETDYCGLASGASVDKAADCRFDVFYGQLESVPMIGQCAVNHSCEVMQILNMGSHELIVGKIVETFVSEESMTQGRPDPVKIRPFMFAGRGYFALGEYSGDAFRCGIAVNPKAKLDTLDELKKMQEKK